MNSIQLTSNASSNLAITQVRPTRKRTVPPSSIETRSAKKQRMFDYTFSEMVDDIVQYIFTNTSLTFKDLSQCFLTCKKWKEILEKSTTGIILIRRLCNQFSQLNLKDRIVPKELNDEPCLRRLAKMGMGYNPTLPWMQQYARWWNRNYVMIIDSSDSMGYFRYENPEEKVWDLTKKVALKWAESLIPLSQNGLRIVPSEHYSKTFKVRCKSEIEEVLREIFTLVNLNPLQPDKMYGGVEAIDRILEEHFSQNSKTKRGYQKKDKPTDIVIISDFSFHYDLKQKFDLKKNNEIQAPINFHLINVGNCRTIHPFLFGYSMEHFPISQITFKKHLKGIYYC